MADPATLAERAKRNGGESEDGDAGGLRGRSSAAASMLGRAGGGVGDAGKRLAGVGADALGTFASRLAGGIGGRLKADLDDRDPDYIRENLPMSWLFASLWYRAEVRNLGNVPEQGPVLLVGNHTGGNMSPDTIFFTLAFRPSSGSSAATTSSPTTSCWPPPSARSCAASAPSPPPMRTPRRRSSRAPPCSSSRAATGRSTARAGRAQQDRLRRAPGFIRLAMNAGVPIVPVVSIGGQETALFLAGAIGSRACWDSTSRCA